MNDLDTLTRRLDELGRRAPVPETDPALDIRRGRAALLRRRRARHAAAITTTVLAVGAAVVAAPLLTGPGGSPVGEPTLHPAGSPSAAPPADQAAVLCPEGRAVGADGRRIGPTSDRTDALASVRSRTRPWNDPVIGPVLDSYRQAVAEVLDPSGQHLDRKVTNVQSACEADGQASLGTKLGWRSGEALGVVQVEVVAPRRHDDVAPTSEALVPQIVMDHDRWAAYDGALPAGVRKARVAADDGGHAVVVKRDDGLTVAVDAAGVWGNNAAPGSPAAGDLPTVERLLALAASPLLTLPTD